MFLKRFLVVFTVLLIPTQGYSLSTEKEPVRGTIVSFDRKTVTIKKKNGRHVRVSRKHFEGKNIRPGKKVAMFVHFKEMRALNPGQ